MKNTRLLILIFSTLLVFKGLCQDKSLPTDSSIIDIRKINIERVDKLKADPEMDYAYSSAAVNLWERFKRWFLNLLSRMLQAAVTTDWVKVLIILLLSVGLIYAVLRLLKVDAFKMFYGEQAGKIDYGVIDDDIHSMDFDKLIEDAKLENEYRLAIRLTFLYALKLLADNQHILWQPGKTNHDYVDELNVKNLKTGFSELSFYFEYAWYGNFSISESQYKKVSDLFSSWKINVGP